MSLDKTYSNAFATAGHLESLWSKKTASRQVARYNQEARNHNRRLQRSLKYKSPGERREIYEEKSRAYIRNDSSSPGHAKIRVFDATKHGVDYILKEEGESRFSSANAYEMSKFGSSSNDDLILSHKLLMHLYKKVGGRNISKKMLREYRDNLDSSSNTGRIIGPQDLIRKTPNRSKQLWDQAPDYDTDTSWSWTESQY